jgi:hypothetical protein
VLHAAIAGLDRFACEPKVNGVRTLVVYGSDGLETRNRGGIRRDWLRGDDFERGLRRLADRLPILWRGTVAPTWRSARARDSDGPGPRTIVGSEPPDGLTNLASS